MITSSCTSTHPASDNYGRIASITNSELQSRLQLKTWGSGVHMKEGKISVYEAFYKIEEPLNIEMARNIVLNTVEIIKHNLNNDSKIQQYLYNTPVENKNLLFSIQYLDLYDYSKMSVTMPKESLYYDTVNPITFKHTLVFKESYDEAIEKAGFCK